MDRINSKRLMPAMVIVPMALLISLGGIGVPASAGAASSGVLVSLRLHSDSVAVTRHTYSSKRVVRNDGRFTYDWSAPGRHAIHRNRGLSRSAMTRLRTLLTASHFASLAASFTGHCHQRCSRFAITYANKTIQGSAMSADFSGTPAGLRRVITYVINLSSARSAATTGQPKTARLG